AELGNGPLESLLDLAPTTGWRAQGVGEGDVVAMRQQLLLGLEIAFHEGINRPVIVLDRLREIVRCHLGTSYGSASGCRVSNARWQGIGAGTDFPGRSESLWK